MMSETNRYPFTASQWQELEQQALIFKYMMSGLPITPELLHPINRTLPFTSRLFPNQSMEWGCPDMSFGRKVDPEPGRCRRTDGKKWRCSKGAFPDSKYCEKHMHRGKNRSRKPVEIINCSTSSLQNPQSQPPYSSSSSSSSSSSHASQNRHHPYCNTSTSLHPYLYTTQDAPSSRPPDTNRTTTHFSLDSNADKDCRYLQGLKEEVDEHPFFSEASGTLRDLGDSRNSSWNPLKGANSSASPTNFSPLQFHSLDDFTKQSQEAEHCFVLGTDFKSERPGRGEGGGGTRRFFDEWPKKRDLWMTVEDDASSQGSFSTTQLSISTPSEFPAGTSGR